MMDNIRKPRSDSKMYQLSKEVLNQINDMLLNENMKYSDIQFWLKHTHNLKISLSSISNYAVKIYRATQRVADDLERTKFFIDFLGDKSDIDASRATTAILRSGLLQKISTAEEEFNEMPIEKAGRLLVELNRNALAEKRLELDYKKKMQLAFDALEHELFEQIKNHPDLKDKVHNVLSECRAQVEKEENQK